MNKTDVCEDLLQDNLNDTETPLACDRGYTTIGLLRFLNAKNPRIPFVGTIRNDFMKGNYPIFPKDKKSGPFRRRMFVYRAKESLKQIIPL